MEKVLTVDQKNTLVAVQETMKSPWRKIIEEFIIASIKAREDILLWKSKVEWLDDIKYSRNTILREELTAYYGIKNYAELLEKELGVYTAKWE